jgi:hypothetical protein
MYTSCFASLSISVFVESVSPSYPYVDGALVDLAGFKSERKCGGHGRGGGVVAQDKTMVELGVGRFRLSRGGGDIGDEASEVCKNDREERRIEVGTILIYSAFWAGANAVTE